jgi:hypothetical protein
MEDCHRKCASSKRWPSTSSAARGIPSSILQPNHRAKRLEIPGIALISHQVSLLSLEIAPMSSKKVLGESDLIFSSASFALKNALGELKRNHQSVGKRLRSIYSDATFVQSVADAYNLPLVANERCGSWYIPQDASVGFAHSKKGSAYFKSTDGHFGQWSFSLRRLNLQVLDLIGQHGG